MTDPDLKELDDLLPPDLVEWIKDNREMCRAYLLRTWTGIPDVLYRTLN